MVNVFYQHSIAKIGGIETFLYELAKKYHNTHDITIYYKYADITQLNRLKKYVRVKQHNNEVIECENFYHSYDYNVLDNVRAKKIQQVVHGDFKRIALKARVFPEDTGVITVSELATESYKELTGKDAKTIYNPLSIDKPNKVLRLISATRLTHEKGKDRMIRLANYLDKHKVVYQWLVFTNDTNAIPNENVIYMKPRLDIRDYIADSDYLVQLSDTEGFGYSIVEALELGTPIIVTDLPILKELGINAEHGVILNMDMSDLDIELIKKPYKFKYKTPEDTWGNELVRSKSNYQEELKMRFKVKATDQFKKLNITDQEVNRIRELGEEFEVNKERLEVLTGNNKYKVKFVELVKEEAKAKPKKSAPKKKGE